MKKILLLIAFAIAIHGQTTKIDGHRVIEGGINHCASATGNDSYSCAFGRPITQYRTGTCYQFQADVGNTGAATVAFSGLAATSIKKVVGGAKADLETGDIIAGGIARVCFDGTHMQLVSLTGSGGGGGSNATQIQGRNVANTAPTDGQVITWNNGASEWQPGTPATNATQIQGRTVANTAPTDGQVITWNNGAGEWQPGTPSGGGAGTMPEGGYWAPFDMPAIDLDYMKTAWANQTYFQMVIPPMNMTINTLRYKVGAACAGACATVWSFYDADKNRITSSDVITDQTTGWKGTTFSAPPTLSAWNIYYVTVSNNDAAWRILCVNHTWDITEALRSTANPRVGTAQNQHTGSGTSITAPATLGTLTQGDGSIGMPAFFVLSR